MPRTMVARRNIPNLLTMLRLVLAGLFFALLAFYKVDQGLHLLLIPAIALFIAAAVTDWLDGMLARRWHVESKFGRIMDPFCDKVLILGALMFLAGPGFTRAAHLKADPADAAYSLVAEHLSGVYPWMVVVIFARELLVTGIRGEMEGTGHKFGANVWGKLKMILQAIVIPIVLLIVYLIDTERYDGKPLIYTRDLLIYATVIVTVLSGVPYITGAYRVTKAERNAPPIDP